MTKANKISLTRLGLIPVYIFLLLFNFGPKFNFLSKTFYLNHIFAQVIFIVILATDWLDGFVARKYKEISEAGELIDPTIDKLVTIMAFTIFVKNQDLSLVVLLIIIFREIFVLGLRLLIISEKGNASAKMLGKIKTALGFILIVSLNMNGILLSENIINISFWLIGILTLVSGIEYSIKAWSLIKNKF